MAGEKVVWILGAGFSRPLGGPLLGDLFGTSGVTRLDAAFGADHMRLKHARKLRNLLNRGLKVGSWSDAEEMLDALDTAARTSDPTAASRRLVDRHITAAFPGDEPNAAAVAHFARYVLAAQCVAFLEDNDPKAERWQPYQAWLESLEQTDTVITFNYDNVVSVLRDSMEAEGVSVSLSTPLPDPAQIRKTSGALRVLKLHGSVDWEFTADGVRAINGPPLGIAEDRVHAVAGPGPSKLQYSKKEFAPLWDAAIAAITEANAVVFVGYRFPPSDANARSRILGALRSNHATDGRYPFVAVHTVLGPNLGDEWQVRMGSLLRGALRHGGRSELGNRPIPREREGPTFRIHQHPMFAQDFFTVIGRKRLVKFE
jgi:hypothetical protein